MLKNYSEIYSSQDIMTKKLCFSAAIVMFTPMVITSSVNAPKNNPISLSNFSEEQLIEIEKYAQSYTEKPYVIEASDEIYVVIPSIYPVSTSVLLLRMDMKPNVFLRFVREREDLFVLSKHITATPVRMSKRLDSQRKDFVEFCLGIERTFMYLSRLNLYFNEDEILDGYMEQVFLISNFLAVPINNISFSKNEDEINLRSSFALFTAFCTNIMMLARNEASDRKINVELNFYGPSVIVKMFFKTINPLRITNETFLWNFLASDKKMFYQYSDKDEFFYVIFEPTYKDWARLGMKQERNDTLFD